MSTEPSRSIRRMRWLDVLLALIVGMGVGVAIDRFALPPTPRTAPQPELEMFEQTGPFAADGGQGEINFPFPYAAPPNVELKYVGRTVKVFEIKTTGFKWQDVGAGSHAAVGTWFAKGIKKTKLP